MAEVSSAAFIAEMTDLGGMTHQYVLSFFERDKSVSLFDIKNKKVFLKRLVPNEHISASQLYVGASVTIASRPLKIVGYADDKTKREFATTRGATLVMVKPDAHQQMGQVLELIYKSGLTVGRMRMVRFNDHDAERFLGASSSSSGSSAPSASAKRSLQGDAMLAIEVAGDDIIARVHELAGPADPADAKEAAPNSIRAIFGTSRDANAVHTSASIETGRSELAYIFDRSYPFTAVGTHCSALVIKPHAVEAKVTGKVLDAVLASGLEISALRSVALSRNDAADYLEPYKTVVPEFERWVKELSSGPCVVVEVRGEGVVPALRELAGPYDPVIAKHLRPSSLRAKYGVDTVKNLCFVTDIERDGPLECKFLFTVV